MPLQLALTVIHLWVQSVILNIQAALAGWLASLHLPPATPDRVFLHHGMRIMDNVCTQQYLFIHRM